MIIFQSIFSNQHHDKRLTTRAGRPDQGHGHVQDGGDAGGDRGDGGRTERSQDRRHRGVLLGRVPMDGQQRVWNQEQSEGVPRQLAETIPGSIVSKLNS